MPAGNPPVGAGTTQAQTQAMSAANAIAVNNQITQTILANSIEVKQNIFSTTINTPGQSSNVLNVPFRFVGLVKGFIVQVTATLPVLTDAGVGSVAPSLTQWGLANLLSNVTLYDLDNYQRINCAGWFLEAVATSKDGFPSGGAIKNASFGGFGAASYPVNYSDNFPVDYYTAPTADVTGTANFYYWVPCAYTGSDLRGAIWAGVVNATAYLQLTINPNPWTVSSGDPTLSPFTGVADSATSFSSVQVTVYQVYLDQGPKLQNGAPLLPPISIATQYRLNTTSLFGLTTNQDFPVQFTNFQQFLALSIIIDQAGTLNDGTDVNYLALAAANTYVPFKLDPYTQAWITRHAQMVDMPLGSYMFSFRHQPISTNQTGNMQLLINATAASGANVLAGFEAFALVNTVLGAASLPAS
jgi:hypothetical protein